LPNTARKNFSCLNAAPEYVSKLRKEYVDIGQVYSHAQRLTAIYLRSTDFFQHFDSRLLDGASKSDLMEICWSRAKVYPVAGASHVWPWTSPIVRLSPSYVFFLVYRLLGYTLLYLASNINNIPLLKTCVLTENSDKRKITVTLGRYDFLSGYHLDYWSHLWTR